jgi:starch phosphorylase
MTPFPALDRILSNLWWSWTPSARALVASIDPIGWSEHRGFLDNYLELIPAARWQELEKDESFLARLTEVSSELENYVAADTTWWLRQDGAKLDAGIAYFSMEFGIHEGLPIYSGGLGVLAGDHLKSASDLGIPLIAVGLFYTEGYFHQTLDSSGWQGERYTRRSHDELGIEELRDEAGEPLLITLPFRGRTLTCRLLGADAGRVPLLLLDTNHPDNTPDDRAITSRLYSGDESTRIAQEVVLGIGGVRALRVLGLAPALYHLNEGHCAFLLAERLREEVEAGTVDPLKVVRESSVFTTHTPVAAGHDRFLEELVRATFEGWPGSGVASLDSLLALGDEPGVERNELCMTALALRGCRTTNGVSEKHGEVSRTMWASIWPEESPTPIGHVTNGVHATTWLGPAIQDLLSRRTPDWRERLTSEARLEEVMDWDPEELWSAHLSQKKSLIELVRQREGVELDPNALVMGFARRFATYKRGDLILSEWERVLRLLADQDRPLQIIYSGKAHPRDGAGKAILQRICEAARDLRVEQRLVVIEDYEIGVGRSMVQGVDVWLNNPRRPREASGTSGQKVAMNGGLNCSTLDGWWLEGYHREPLAGWAVGSEQVDVDLEAGDRADASALYRLLEEEILPCFYRRDPDGLPQDWIHRMKSSIAVCLPAFNTDRMLADYVESVYLGGAG